MLFDQLIASTHRLRKLKTHILSLDSALMYPEAKIPVKFPALLIRNVQFDDQDQIWFSVRKNLSALPQEQNLPVQLRFFKKGMPYWIQITGVASFKEEAPESIQQALSSDEEDCYTVKVQVHTIKETDISC